MADSYAQTYSKEQGYKPNPALKPSTASGMPSADAIAAELARRQKAGQ
jgi:hypothetical protein